MDRDCDVFEVYPDHTIRWRICVRGTRPALDTLEALAKQTVNECFATDIGTQEIIGRVNEGRAAARILENDWGRHEVEVKNSPDADDGPIERHQNKQHQGLHDRQTQPDSK